jgi:hypothetical protein
LLYEAPRSRARDTQIERVVDDTTAPASVSLFAGTTTGKATTNPRACRGRRGRRLASCCVQPQQTIYANRSTTFASSFG